MSTRNNISSKAFKDKRNDTVVNKMLIVFLLLSISVFALISYKNNLDSPDSGLLTFMTKPTRFLIMIPSVAFLAYTVLYFIKNIKARTDERLKLFSSGYFLGIALTFFVSTLLIAIFPYKACTPVIVLTVITSLLYFMCVSFPGPCFALTCFNSFAGFSFFAIAKLGTEYSVGTTITKIICVIISAIVFFLTLQYKKNGGSYFGIKLFKAKADYFPLLFSIAFYALLVLISLAKIGSPMIYIIAIVAQTILFALYYAIKMLK